MDPTNPIIPVPTGNIHGHHHPPEDVDVANGTNYPGFEDDNDGSLSLHDNIQAENKENQQSPRATGQQVHNLPCVYT